MWIIYLKEMVELVRDRKTFIFTVLIPVFAMPMLFGGLGLLSNSMFKKAEQAELTYTIFGKANAPELSARFAHDRSFREVPIDSVDAIKSAI